MISSVFSWVSDNKNWLFDGVGGGIVVYVLNLIFRKKKIEGGRGGNAEVMGDGEAHGGRGGNSGPFGPGGNGGNARVNGNGKAVGGRGGNG